MEKPMVTAGNEMMQTIAPQRGASPLAVSGDRVALLTGEGVTLRALGTGASRTIPVGKARGLGVLADGAFVVLSDDGPAALRIAGDGPPERHEGMMSLHEARVRVMALADEGAFLSAGPGESAWWHQLGAGGELKLLGRIEVEDNGHATVAWGHDRAIVYALSGELVRRDVEGKETRTALPGTRVWHLAPGPGPDLVWMTTDAGKLQLVRLGDAAAVLASFDLGGVPVHLHASGERAAVVVGDTGEGKTPFAVALFDRAGENWRAPLSERDPYAEVFVASSPTHVAVVAADRIEAWTSEGQPIRP